MLDALKSKFQSLFQEKPADTYESRKQFVITNSETGKFLSPFKVPEWDRGAAMYIHSGDKSYLIGSPLEAKLNEIS